jgi:hypothetical protein
MKKNPDTAAVLSRSPVGGNLGIHVRRAYRAARAEKNRAPLLRAILSGTKSKAQADKVLRAQPPFKPDPTKIIIDVTHFCNMHCENCNRSCGGDQANAQEHMTVDQIKRFVRESISQKRRWSEIMLEGGEPTLNPHILEIVDELVRYKRQHSPKTRLALCTNGYCKPTRRIMEKMPPEVDVVDSGKETEVQDHHRNFNVAPIDLRPDDCAAFSNGCVLPCIYGIGLNRYGYYPHPVCGAIDRVFGHDVGRKSLPEVDDTLVDMYQHLCRYCGHFWDSTSLEEPAVSASDEVKDGPPRTASWRRAYGTYDKSAPKLRLY